MKCLPQSKIPLANGNVLHDWHAEVLAIRSFNRFLIDECEELAREGFGEGREGKWVKWREEGLRYAAAGEGHAREGSENTNGDSTFNSDQQGQPFALQDDVRIHMYCSEAPCGDASMELTMAAQEDDTPWEKQEDGLLGRGNFDQLGIVRRKPSRPDAPQSLSKSCSDKLAMKQCTGLLCGLSSLLIHPANVYISTLVLPSSQCVESAVHRAFHTRMTPVMTGDVQRGWHQHGYTFKPFQVQTTSREFSFSKRAAGAEVAIVPSNLSAAFTPRTQEVQINGVLQGRRQFDPRGASFVGRRSLWSRVLSVAVLACLPALAEMLQRSRSYRELKMHAKLGGRETVKRETRERALKGWQRNEGDDSWTLDCTHGTLAS